MASEDELYGSNTITLLQRIARELTTIRQQVTEGIKMMRDAETEIPEYMRRFMNYMHDLQDIKYMYEDLGHQVPEHHKRESERCDDRFRQLVKKLNTDGGTFEKVRAKMAADPENKWDHTRLLYPPKPAEEKLSETGPSIEQRSGSKED